VDEVILSALLCSSIFIFLPLSLFCLSTWFPVLDLKVLDFQFVFLQQMLLFAMEFGGILGISRLI